MAEIEYSSIASCRAAVISSFWWHIKPDPFASEQVAKTRFECRACGRQTSVTAGTIFHRSHKPLKLWFRAMWCVASRKDGASALWLQSALKLDSYQTAWTWLHKLRRAMVPTKPEPLAGIIEVTTTWLWGMPDPGTRKQAKGLVILAAEVDGTGIGRMGWAGLEQKGYCLEASQGEGKNAFRCTPHADCVAEKLERWLSETFRGAVRGAVSQGHLPFYLDEFTFRFNARKAKSRRALFGRLVRQAVATDPVPYRSM
jgi:hypothetical protein